MKKLKKFLYPVMFVAGFFVWDFITALAINIIDTIRSFEGYGALGVFLAALLAYVLLGLPLYCVRYSRIIIDEKLNLLFAGYNFVVLETACLITVNGLEEAKLPLSLWILFWSVVPFLLRMASKKRKADPTKSELPPKTAFLFQNKTKHIVAICFVSLYVIMLLREPLVLQFFELPSFMYGTLPAISAVFLLVFLLTKGKNYILKDYMLSIVLAGEAVSKVFSDCFSLNSFSFMLKIDPLYPATMLSCLITIMVILMLVGTLFDFKYIKLLKIGSLSCVVLCGARLVLELVDMLFFAEWMNLYYPVFFLTRTLYFAGIYVLTTNERSEEVL